MRLSNRLIVTLLMMSQGLFGIVRIEEATNPPPCKPPSYILYDMGETTVDPALLNPFALPRTFAPRINNQRQISANRIDEGYFRDLDHGELVSQIGYCLRGFAFGLNDNGEIIATLERNKGNVDWFVWKQKNLRKEKRYPVEPPEGLSGLNVELRAISNNGWAVGSMNPGCVLRPAVWNASRGLKPFGFYVGWDFKGAAWGINKKGTIVGFVSECCEEPPFVWNEQCGLEILRNYRIPFEAQSSHEIHGTVRFADMLVTDDDYVYGTLWIDEGYYDDDGRIRYFAYRWEPYNHDFRYLDLEGMRLNGVNKNHTLVGSLDRQAALRERGEKPILLQKYVQGDDWHLIEATGINDHGDIVGYGTFRGATHVFLMKKE